MQNRRQFLRTAASGLVASIVSVPLLSCQNNEKSEPPNVIVILTDDQGYGDFGVTGNPLIKTPNIDSMASRSAWMTNFYVSPVCAPTRSCLMTGRYNYRTRCIDTFIGRAMMDTEEVTLAEVLKDAGYATGIFGKWHMGDNYPMRPQDQGFEETLVLRGGGIGQPSDPPGGEGKYTDPILFHNGEQVAETGYCTDVYFDHAMQWIEQTTAQGRNFFAYIPTNAPHTPLNDVPSELYNEYKKMDLSNDQFPQEQGHKLQEDNNSDRRARIYAMLTNIDDNVGKLFKKLDALNLTENTLIFFWGDNGPDSRRYRSGFQGHKGTVYEGGIRSPLFIHWPEKLDADTRSDKVVAHLDLFPTILQACHVQVPQELKLDGKSFLPLLTQENAEWPDRNLVIQAHRGDAPVLYHNFAIRNQKWKLLHASGFGRENFDGAPKFELFNMQNDPYEMHNVAAENPTVVQELKQAYEQWFKDVSNTRPDNYAPPRIFVGTPYENPVVLTRQDWRHFKGRPWAEDSNGLWMLTVTESGKYDVLLRFHSEQKPGKAELKTGDQTWSQTFHKDQTELIFHAVQLNKGDLDLQTTLTCKDMFKGAWQVEVKQLGSSDNLLIKIST